VDAQVVDCTIATVSDVGIFCAGEANAGNPVGYERCFPAMIEQWRTDFRAGSNNATNATAPFIFVQLSSWPAGDNGVIAVQRYAQQAALSLPNVGMVVAADIGDPAGAEHPIHPPWKAEVGRRANLIAQHLLYNQIQFPLQGPVVKNVSFDSWDASWGDFHYGYGGAANACSQFLCGGIRVTFDQPITVQSTYGLPYGFVNGFEVFDGPEANVQPATLTGIRTDDPNTLQLNITWIFGNYPVTLKYGWHDYPSMFVFNSFGQPAPPFNFTITH
jgi:hypothetical protein